MDGNQQKLIGLMLYAGEGAKTGRTVDFINSNPILVKAFVRFLREYCQIKENRLKFYLYCFDNQSTTELVEFWCEYLEAQSDQFTKPYIRRGRVRNSNRIAKFGVLHVRYSDKKLLDWILNSINSTLNTYG